MPAGRRTVLLCSATALAAMLSLGVALPTTAGAAPADLVVRNTADSGPGSLRAVLDGAPAASTVRFDPSLAQKTIGLSGGQLTAKRDVIIDGADAPGVTVSGRNASRVLFVPRNVNITIRNLAVVDGRAMGPDLATGAGGGLFSAGFNTVALDRATFRGNSAAVGGAVNASDHSTVTVTGSVFENNDGTLARNGFSGGAVSNGAGGTLTVKNSRFRQNKGWVGGAIYSLLGPLRVEGSEFTDNSSPSGGGAIYTDGAAPRGACGKSAGGPIDIVSSSFRGNRGTGEGGALFLYVYCGDRVLIDRSTIVGNTAVPDSRGVALGGGLRGSSSGTLTIRGTTIADNTARQGGGVAVLEDGEPAAIENSTFSGNKAVGGGNASQGGALVLINNSRPLAIRQSTIVNNSADFASAAFAWFAGNPSISLADSIVAGNSARTFDRQTLGTLQDKGGNIEFPAPPAGDPNAKRVTTGSRIVDPRLGPLGVVDGALVHRPLAGSPALDGGRQAGAQPVDQSGGGAAVGAVGTGTTGATAPRSLTPASATPTPAPTKKTSPTPSSTRKTSSTPTPTRKTSPTRTPKDKSAP